MKFTLLVWFFLLTTVTGQSQKTPLDTSVLEKFQLLDYNSCSISNNGKFVSYSFYCPERGAGMLTVQSTIGNWKVSFPDAQGISFSKNDRQFIFSKLDTLFFLSLIDKKIEKVPLIDYYTQPISNKQSWLAYKLKDDKTNLILRNLLTNKENTFPNIKDFYFDERGDVLILSSARKNSSADSVLLWYDLQTGAKRNILKTDCNQSDSIMKGQFDRSSTQLTFIVKKKDDLGSYNTICRYKKDMETAEIVVDERYSKIPMPLATSTPPFFSEDGKHILFRLQDVLDTSSRSNNGVMVNVWSYKDSILQTAQVNNFAGPIGSTPSQYLFATFSTDNKKFARLEDTNHKVAESGNNGCFVVSSVIGQMDHWWSASIREETWLTCLWDTIVKRTSLNTAFLLDPIFSPDGKYLVFYDQKEGAYFSMNVSSDSIVNISKAVPANLTNGYHTSGLSSLPLPAGVAGWLSDGSAILVYDAYDIWQLDVTGEKDPINVTNGYGARHKIKFRLINDEVAKKNGLSRSETLFLSAFGTINKFDGFFKTSLASKSNPYQLNFGPSTWSHLKTLFNGPSGEKVSNFGMNPIKSANSNSWIAVKQTANSAPNLYFTEDLKQFSQLTNVQPHKNYNWYTAELINWKQTDGMLQQGILYKPEDFNPQQKYPVIFCYYEQLSHMLYDYLYPSYAIGTIDIPYFVSNGYLVFAADVTYTAGKTGKSVYASVMSAVDHLLKCPYVDSSRLAITGVSFGGYQTNYLLTHSTIFAAAAEGCGVSDLVSFYGALGGRPGREYASNQYKVEWGQYRMNATIWDDPNAYIENSPIFHLDKVTTPLLIMHNRSDVQVSWYQGVELFTGLRRLRKKVWMLEYDKGTHGVSGKDALDYTVRLKQFFDHYLKAAPPPKWMTTGIPARKKGRLSGLELDDSSVTP